MDEIRLPVPAPMPPHGKAHLLIRQLLKAGLSAAAVSRASACTSRYVYYIKAKMKAEQAAAQ